MKTYKKRFIFSSIAFAALLIAAIYYLPELLEIFLWLWSVLKPLTLGLLFAFILNVPLSAIELSLNKLMRRISQHALRTISIIVTLLLTIAVLSLVVIVIAPQLILSIESIIDAIPAYVDSLSNWISTLFPNVDISELLSDPLAALSQLIPNNASESIAQVLINTILSLASGIVTTSIAFVIAIYVLFVKEKLSRYSRRLLALTLEPRHCDALLRISRMTNEVFSAFIGGQILDAIILGVICYIGMLLLNLPYAPALSVLIAITALIPLAGSFIGEIIGAIILLTTTPINAVVFVAMMLVLQQIEGSFIYPKVVGTSVRLPPLLVLTSVIVGGNIAGVLGAVLGVPIAALAFALIKGLIMAGDDD